MDDKRENPLAALLLVDDDPDLREQMKWALAPEYIVLEASDRRTALALVRRETPPLVLLDLGLPPDTDGASEGLATLREILQFDPTVKIVVVTGNSDRAKALAAIDGGAYDFIEKPVQLDVLRVVLQRAAYLSSLEQENRAILLRVARDGFEEILGVSPVMKSVFDAIRRVGASDVPVLITGESGTGKELVAQAIHRRSARKEGPFIAINCSAIPETLLETELFGYEKGAFTGASRQQKGKLEYANRGTLLLDEVGEMPLALQVKLLRFLQDGRVERVGGRASIAIDARVLAATNANLRAAIETSRFREDLFYRLSVINIPLPPLRERGDDVLLLAKAFLLRYRKELNSRVTTLSNEARDAIRAYAWPGNVRELENRLKRAVIMATGPSIRPADLDLPEEGLGKLAPTLREARVQLDKELIQRALILQNGNITKAAEDLGISRQAIHDFIKKYGLLKV
jgi:two-component system, NtrC family, response regulator